LALVKLDERDLVEAHCAGDVAAFPEIVRLHYAALLVHAVRRLNDRGAAEDAVQETFLRAYGALPRFGGEFRLAGWLHRILSNVCADEARRRSRDVVVSDPLANDAAPTAPDLADASTTRAVVQHALSLIPVAHREALLLREIEGMDYRDVAAAAGISEENARARVHRARHALRSLLGAGLGMVVALIGLLRRLGHSASTTPPASAQALSDPTAMQLVANVGPARIGVITTVVGAAAAAVTVIPTGAGFIRPLAAPRVATTVRAGTRVSPGAQPQIVADAPPLGAGRITDDRSPSAVVASAKHGSASDASADHSDSRSHDGSSDAHGNTLSPTPLGTPPTVSLPGDPLLSLAGPGVPAAQKCGRDAWTNPDGSSAHIKSDDAAATFRKAIRLEGAAVLSADGYSAPGTFDARIQFPNGAANRDDSVLKATFSLPAPDGATVHVDISGAATRHDADARREIFEFEGVMTANHGQCSVLPEAGRFVAQIRFDDNGSRLKINVMPNGASTTGGSSGNRAPSPSPDG